MKGRTIPPGPEAAEVEGGEVVEAESPFTLVEEEALLLRGRCSRSWSSAAAAAAAAAAAPAEDDGRWSLVPRSFSRSSSTRPFTFSSSATFSKPAMVTKRDNIRFVNNIRQDISPH